MVAQLKEFEARYPGLGHVNVSAAVGTPAAVILGRLEWFAKEAVAAFKSKHVAAQAQD